MDAKVIKELSRMCRQKAETFSTNIQPFHYHEYAEKLANLMAGRRDAEGNVTIKMKQWTRFGKNTKSSLATFLLSSFYESLQVRRQRVCSPGPRSFTT